MQNLRASIANLRGTRNKNHTRVGSMKCKDILI